MKAVELSVVVPAGRLLAHDEVQRLDAMAAAPDGTVWLEVASNSSEDLQPPPTLSLGGRTFTDAATYLYKLVC